MKAVREKSLDPEYVVSALQLSASEAASVGSLIRWLQCHNYWRKNRDSLGARNALEEATGAVGDAFPDYNRRMYLMNELLGL